MPYIDPALCAKAKEIDLLTYFQLYEPHELVRKSGSEYHSKVHDSLTMSNGLWHWHSRGIGGKTAVSYFVDGLHMPYTEAVLKVTNGTTEMPSFFCAQNAKVTPEKAQFILPKANDNCDRVRAYLNGRGIHDVVVDHCIQKKLLYEENKYHNVVFVGYDNEKKPKYACKRGVTDKRFFGEVSGSDKRYSFSILSENQFATLHLFEGAIDVLSYCTLELLAGRKFEDDHLLSLGGVALQSSGLPLALTQYLSDHTNINKVVLHLDSDVAGRNVTSAIMSSLPEHIKALDEPPSSGKDVNDQLKNLLQSSSRNSRDAR